MSLVVCAVLMPDTLERSPSSITSVEVSAVENAMPDGVESVVSPFRIGDFNHMSDPAADIFAVVL